MLFGHTCIDVMLHYLMCADTDDEGRLYMGMPCHDMPYINILMTLLTSIYLSIYLLHVSAVQRESGRYASNWAWTPVEMYVYTYYKIRLLDWRLASFSLFLLFALRNKQVRVLVLLWRLGATSKPGSISRTEFTDGMKREFRSHHTPLHHRLDAHPM